MLRLFAGALVLTLVALPATAQTRDTSPGATPDITVPEGNSGAKVQGLPGNKSGPAVKPSETTGANSGMDQTQPNKDAAKVKGLPGNKSGPAVEPPSSGSK
jgi:hypothetical protein